MNGKLIKLLTLSLFFLTLSNNSVASPKVTVRLNDPDISYIRHIKLQEKYFSEPHWQTVEKEPFEETPLDSSLEKNTLYHDFTNPNNIKDYFDNTIKVRMSVFVKTKEHGCKYTKVNKSDYSFIEFRLAHANLPSTRKLKCKRKFVYRNDKERDNIIIRAHNFTLEDIRIKITDVDKKQLKKDQIQKLKLI